jgi:ankyrin repeat protein
MAFLGRTPLWNALLTGKVAEAVQLLDGGAKATEERDAKTPMQFFAENKKIAKPELFDALLRHKGIVDNTCLYRACSVENVNAVRLFLEAKHDGRTHFDVNIVHPVRRNTPLVVAVQNENPAICKLLLRDAEIDPNIHVEDGYTALYYAASENLFDIVELLLQNPRTDPNIQLGDRSPLHKAIMNNNHHVVRLLTAHPRINLYLRDRFEATPLDIAIAMRNPDIIALLSVFPLPPLPTPPLTTPLVVHNYAAMPDATDILEIEDNPVNTFDENYMVFKIGGSYFALPKEKVRNDIQDEDGDRILFECMGQLGGAPRIEQVHADQKYFVLAGIGNYVIPLEHILGALVHPTNIFEITGPIRRLDNVASYSAVAIQGERGFKHRRVNIVSRAHCQAGTDKQLYHLHPVRIDIAAAPAAAPVAANANARRGGARRKTQRRRTNRHRHSRTHKV